MNNETTPVSNFEKPVLPVADPVMYGAVRAAIENAFSSDTVTQFLRSLEQDLKNHHEHLVECKEPFHTAAN